MKPEIVGISRIFKEDDPALRRETLIKCVEVKDGKYRRKTLMMTQAERWLLESIAMRIFINRKKYVDMTKTVRDDGTVEMKAILTVEKL